jgi:purine-nucleoside phosphorylase
MSTVHEVIAARHLGMEVLGLSSVTNMAAGVLGSPDQVEPINHAEVLEIGARVQQTLTRLLAALVPLLADR